MSAQDENEPGGQQDSDVRGGAGVEGGHQGVLHSRLVHGSAPPLLHSQNLSLT